MASKSPLRAQRCNHRLSTTPVSKHTFSSNMMALRTTTPVPKRKNNENACVKPNQPAQNEVFKTNRLIRVTSGLAQSEGDKKLITRSKSPLALITQRSFPKDEMDITFTGSIDNYTVGGLLGCGSYSIVRESTHKETKIKYAIKSYEKAKIMDPQKRKNMRNEIKILQKLDHPYIIKLKETIDSANHVHLVMQHVNGSSFNSYLKRQKSRILPDEDARKYFAQVVAAVGHIHSLNIIHRDIKLENILVDSNNQVKLIDFGFSSENFKEKIKLFCGTPCYMSPEIVSKREYFGGPADVWALGVLLFVMLTGFFPFKSNSDRELYRKILMVNFEIPSFVAPQARLLIKRMMQLDPYKRPSCKQVLEDPWMNPKAQELRKPGLYLENLSI